MEALDDGWEEQGERVQRRCVEDVGDHVHVDLPVGEDIAELLPRKVSLRSRASVDDQTLNSQILLLLIQKARI